MKNKLNDTIAKMNEEHRREILELRNRLFNAGLKTAKEILSIENITISGALREINKEINSPILKKRKK